MNNIICRLLKIYSKHFFYLQITKHNFHVQIIKFVTNFTNAAFTYIVNREIFCQLDKYIHNLIIKNWLQRLLLYLYPVSLRTLAVFGLITKVLPLNSSLHSLGEDPCKYHCKKLECQETYGIDCLYTHKHEKLVKFITINVTQL